MLETYKLIRYVTIAMMKLILFTFGIDGQSEDNLDEDDIWMLEEIKSMNSDDGSGGGDSGGKHDLVPDQLGTVEILAIIIGSIIVLGIVVFLGACAWHRARPGNNSFNPPLNDDESALHMVDYDDLSIQNARLSVDLPTNTTTESDT